MNEYDFISQLKIISTNLDLIFNDDNQAETNKSAIRKWSMLTHNLVLIINQFLTIFKKEWVQLLIKKLNPFF